MKRISYFPFAALLLSLFLVVSLPKEVQDSARSSAVTCASLPWRAIHHLRIYLLRAPTLSDRMANNRSEQLEELSKLTFENQNLKAQLQGVYEWLLFDQRIEEQTEKLKIFTKEAETKELYWREFFQRRSEELKKLLEMQMQALPANIIYREPSSWSSSLWLDVGERDNENLGKLVVAKNSPVLLGNALVGVVEYVGHAKSRVRLITDSGLIPSVRAVRGSLQDRELARLIEMLSERISARSDIFSAVEKEECTACFSHLKEKLPWQNDRYLAKGELQGASLPLWRSKGQYLKGIGFNYDYPDEEGSARDLSTGKMREKKGSYQLESEPILQNGDLLVTSGLDGVFPAGLPVAFITRILPLEEGGYAYDLEAKPCAFDLDEMATLFVLPPREEIDLLRN